MWRGAPSRVRPAAYGEPWFDPNQQMLVWPLLDVTGEVLRAELPWSELHAHAIARIEALGTVAHGPRSCFARA